MQHLYHLVPENQSGKTLLPLNQLKEKFPNIYKKAIEKYDGREEVPLREVPPLNCLRGDVLHLTPVHPSKITKALRSAGFKAKTHRWYGIDPSSLDKSRAIIYIHKFKEKPSEFSSKDNFDPLSKENLSKYTSVPERTLDYYRQKVREGEKPLRFLFIPHVFYKGTIDTTGLEIIEA